MLTPKLVPPVICLSAILSVSAGVVGSRGFNLISMDLFWEVPTLLLNVAPPWDPVKRMETVGGEKQGEKVMLVSASAPPMLTLHMMPVQRSFTMQLLTRDVSRRAIRVSSAAQVSLHCICALASAMIEMQ